MKTDDKIRDEKLQYNINLEVAKISAFRKCFGKTSKNNKRSRRKTNKGT